jgi:hypothetical protein
MIRTFGSPEFRGRVVGDKGDNLVNACESEFSVKCRVLQITDIRHGDYLYVTGIKVAPPPGVAYRSPLLQNEVFEEPYPGLGVHSADLLQRCRLLFRLLSTLCGTMGGQ